jgi:hypothetical protein
MGDAQAFLQHYADLTNLMQSLDSHYEAATIYGIVGLLHRSINTDQVVDLAPRNECQYYVQMSMLPNKSPLFCLRHAGLCCRNKMQRVWK